MEITRELLFGVENSIVLTFHYVIFIIAGLIFLIGVIRWYNIIRSGRRDEPRFDKFGERVVRFFRDAIFFIRLYLIEAKIGVMHILILWGFVILTIGTIILTIADHITSSFFKGTFYLIHEALMDIAGVALIVGIFIAIINRYLLKPSRFQKRYPAWDDSSTLLLLLIISILGFIVESLRIASGSPAYTAFIGKILSPLFKFNLTDYRIAWSIHSLLAIIFIALIPFTKLSHIIASPLNILTRTRRISWREIEDEDYMGAINAEDLQWRDLLSSIACMRCGRCQNECPATNSGTTLSPMFLMQNLRKELSKAYDILGRRKRETTLLNKILDMEAVWACTTCRACMETCPIYIEQMEIIGEMRRGIVESGEAPPDIRDFLNNMQKQRNPWGEGKYKRDAWMKDLDVPKVKDSDFEWLWWVGCQVFDSRNREIARKIVRILNEVGVSYAVLGREEGCCGNDVRRVGEEGLFQLMREENLAIFEKYGVKKIIVTSPHCFNAFKNEYGNQNSIEVKSILEVIHEAIINGKLKLKNPINAKVTFHDPCYLGRWNKLYELPREILKAIPGIEIVEMPRNREKSFCCGGGGGNLVREYPGEDRPNNIRAREAFETGADLLAVACPFCIIMLEDGVKTQKLDEKIKVVDILEIVYKSAFGE